MPRSKNSYSYPGRGFLSSPPSAGGSLPIGGFAQTQRAREDADSKRRDEEMIRRVVFGDVGDKGEGDFGRKLSEEIQSPAAPMTEAETKFRTDPFAVEKLKRIATTRPPVPRSLRGSGSARNQIEAAFTYGESFNPGDIDPTTGSPVDWNLVSRKMAERFKNVDYVSDPRFGRLKNKFDPKDEPRPTKFGQTKSGRRYSVIE